MPIHSKFQGKRWNLSLSAMFANDEIASLVCTGPNVRIPRGRCIVKISYARTEGRPPDCETAGIKERRKEREDVDLLSCIPRDGYLSPRKSTGKGFGFLVGCEFVRVVLEWRREWPRTVVLDSFHSRFDRKFRNSSRTLRFTRLRTTGLQRLGRW